MADSRAVAEAAQDVHEYLMLESKKVLKEPEDVPKGLSSHHRWAPTGLMGQFEHQHKKTVIGYNPLTKVGNHKAAPDK